MDKILAFIKEAKWFSIAIGIFMFIWLGPKLLDKIGEIQEEAERQARIEQQEIARQLQQEQLQKDALNAMAASKAKAQKPSNNKVIDIEYLGFVCNRPNTNFQIKFILEKHDGIFVSASTLYQAKTDGVDKRIETHVSDEKSGSYWRFSEKAETLQFNIDGKYGSRSLLGAMLTLDRTDLSFKIIKASSLGDSRIDTSGSCRKIDYQILLKEQTEHNLKIKENNVL